MKIDSTITQLVKKMIECHSIGDFETLISMMDPSAISGIDSFFNHDKFISVSERIGENLGKLISLNYIGCLKKDGAIQTLWKAAYSKTTEEILWQAFISSDKDNPKIIRMSVN